MKLPIVFGGLSVGFIDLADRRVYSNKTFSFTCLQTAKCCMQMAIPVTDFDVDRIETYGYEVDQIIEVLSPVLRIPKTIRGNVEKNYWIKKKPYIGGCRFLEEDRCSIHEVKPFGCRVFPFSFYYRSDTLVEVLVHESNICDGIEEEDDGNSVLEELMEVLLEEMEIRDRYFDTHKNKI
ncbi:MAG: YkgJ family cysteine cluster protein [Candidatus Heimdallarchaeota archaeon]|nr:YkgJ family cysteine cluster protein [Candidatus Heimdallarchaeota archaeon]